ncbi:MAG TPA: sulfite exporter TauE/SafE family protein [Methylomirabilota bacterium]|nr:sulfite exporter TauE/SafE family protein [Methylomirabilota bacterium]
MCARYTTTGSAAVSRLRRSRSSQLLCFPVHIATATSQFTLAVMALAGSLVHVATGAFHRGVRRPVALTIGVLLGAPLGAWLSSRLHEDWIVRALASYSILMVSA